MRVSPHPDQRFAPWRSRFRVIAISVSEFPISRFGHHDQVET